MEVGSGRKMVPAVNFSLGEVLVKNKQRGSNIENIKNQFEDFPLSCIPLLQTIEHAIDTDL